MSKDRVQRVTLRKITYVFARIIFSQKQTQFRLAESLPEYQLGHPMYDLGFL